MDLLCKAVFRGDEDVFEEAFFARRDVCEPATHVEDVGRTVEFSLRLRLVSTTSQLKTSFFSSRVCTDEYVEVFSCGPYGTVKD